MNPKRHSTPKRKSNHLNTSPTNIINRSSIGDISPISRVTNAVHSSLIDHTDKPSRFPAFCDQKSSENIDDDHSRYSIIPRNLFNRPSVTFDLDETRDDRLYELRIACLTSDLPGAAIFFGEQLLAKTDSIGDIYYLAVTYYREQQYHRALYLLNRTKVLHESIKCRYLAALCCLALEDGKDALDYLNIRNPFEEKVTMDSGLKLEAIMCYARGNAYVLLKDLKNAKDCYKEALTIDLRCYDALESLIKYNMMEEKEEWEFVMTLPFDAHCGADGDYFRYFYSLKLKKNIVSASKSITDYEDLKESIVVKHSNAEAYFEQGKYKECLKICKEISEQDPYYKDSVPTYLTCLYKLNNKSHLYEYSQKLVQLLEDDYISWYAVGMYYLYTKNNTKANQSFVKAIELNPLFFQGWLGVGKSFTAEKNHEKAIKAYTECYKLMPGLYLPLMRIGMEYMAQSNLDGAFYFFNESRKRCDHSPYLENEIGKCYYESGYFEKALKTLHGALKLAKTQRCPNSKTWERIWYNLGYLYLKQEQYPKALKCFQNALSKNYFNSDARKAVAIIYQQTGHISRAISEYQLALKNTTDDELRESIEKLMQKVLSSETNRVETVQGITFDFSFIDIAKRDVNTKDEVDEELGEYAWDDKDNAEDEDMILENSMSVTDDFSYFSSDRLIIDTGDLGGWL